MDNLSVHKSERVREIIEEAGAEILYLPPYSPDFSRIEQCWSKIKTALRAAKARTREEMEKALAQAIKRLGKAVTGHKRKRP